MEGDLRLTGGVVEYEGNLEVCLFNVWSPVCSHDWSETDSKVACRQLGFTTGNPFSFFKYYVRVTYKSIRNSH